MGKKQYKNTEHTKQKAKYTIQKHRTHKTESTICNTKTQNTKQKAQYTKQKHRTHKTENTIYNTRTKQKKTNIKRIIKK
jgi:uncharacterized SAM-binding protein YcdF (DUF218 family)